MKKYLALFVAPIEAYDKMKEQMKVQTKEEQQAGMEEWKTWMERHQANLADPGAPVGKTKRVTEDGEISDIRNTVGGYMLIQADSHDEAAAIFKDSPHFGVEGGGVEIMEIVDM